MSHTDLDDIFLRFKENFPPTHQYIEGITLRLTTAELEQMFIDFYPGIETGNVYSLMTGQGYEFLPVEYNETITFYWLIGRKA